jgi:Flp pilus assembly protein TadB
VGNQIVWSIVTAIAFGTALAGLYISWPRRMTAEEWVLHRRKLRTPVPGRRTRFPAPALKLGRIRLDLDQNRRFVKTVEKDLALVALADGGLRAESSLTQRLLSTAVVTTGAGAVAGLLLWVITGAQGFPLIAFVLAALGGLAGPPIWLIRLRLAAARLRGSIHRRLPRLFTGARMLLESGAATPEAALTGAVGIYRDPAADLLREALRLRQVRRVELESTLEEVSERYGVEALVRLADAYRMGGRYGTKMSELLAEFSASLRHGWHAEYRERITRAPVLMTVPALIFFVAPLLLLTLYLVFAPLSRMLTEI